MADGQFHSGESLGQELGVSRAAVWKQLQRLAADTGLHVKAVKGRGYCISGGVDLLDEDAIRAAMSMEGRSLLRELRIFPCVESTNDLVMAIAQDEPVSGLVITAERQLAGRGRRGRQWISPFAQNLYCSALWSFEQGVRATEGLSLAVGVAIAEGLMAEGLEDVELKWPNDVLWQGRKLGGVLLELTGDLAGPCQVVVGFGVNVAMREESAAEIGQAWTDVHSALGRRVPRSRLLGAILAKLLPLLSRYEDEGFAAWRPAWERRDALVGRTVVAHLHGGTVVGEACGLAADGALRLRTAEGEQLIHGGEVTVRARA